MYELTKHVPAALFMSGGHRHRKGYLHSFNGKGHSVKRCRIRRFVCYAFFFCFYFILMECACLRKYTHHNYSLIIIQATVTPKCNYLLKSTAPFNMGHQNLDEFNVKKCLVGTRHIKGPCNTFLSNHSMTSQPH